MTTFAIPRLIEYGASERRFEFWAQGYHNDIYWEPKDGAREFEVLFPHDRYFRECGGYWLEYLNVNTFWGGTLRVGFLRRFGRFYLLPYNTVPDPNPSYRRRKPETSVQYVMLYGILRAYCAELEATQRNLSIHSFFDHYFDQFFGFHLDELVKFEKQSVREYARERQRNRETRKEARERLNEKRKELSEQQERLKQEIEQHERLIKQLEEQERQGQESEAQERQGQESEAQESEAQESEAQESEAQESEAQEFEAPELKEQELEQKSEPESMGGSNREEVERRHCKSAPRLGSSSEKDDKK
ncbi:hypothetical protein CMUS01_05285 [Colletotrichum musicola]|uniref:Uncharacterized protein n=1 Tax=Colletotrichum musicola TaxID=2175873 RepID=A0A8H6KT59_9PEZI|nr:hypothetical protein CMUS01_05285 [Colletotrichum musicola]